MAVKGVEVRKRAPRIQIQKIILGTVAIAGLITVAAVAPNALGAMAKLGIVPGKRQREVINRSRDRLIQQGLISRTSGKLCLTAKGEKALRILELADFAQKKPKRWDGKWRVLVFDIPETRRSTRERVRRTLAAIGFLHLQDSVWLYPYDCEDLVTLLKVDFRVGKDLLYLIVESLEGDSAYRHKFELEA